MQRNRGTRAWMWALGLALCVSCAVSCSDDPVKTVEPGPPFDPNVNAATVRLVHVASSLGPVTAELDRPSSELVEPDGGGDPVQGPPTLQAMSPAAVLYTGYSPKAQYAPTPEARLNVSSGDTVLFEETLTLEANRSYLAVLVESAGQTGVELIEGYSPPVDAVADGQVRVSVFHAAQSVPTFDMAIRRLDGGADQAQWADLSFGVSHLHQPQVVSPGDYELLLVDSSGVSLAAVAPSSLHLEADTNVQMLIADPPQANGLPLMIFIVESLAQE